MSRTLRNISVELFTLLNQHLLKLIPPKLEMRRHFEFTPPKCHSGYRLQFITKIAIIVP